MSKQKKAPWQFWTQMIPLILLVAGVCCVITQPNTIEGELWKHVTSYCWGIAAAMALPIGICGVRWSDETNGWYKATKVFAILNLWIVGLMVAALVLFLILILSGVF